MTIHHGFQIYLFRRTSFTIRQRILLLFGLKAETEKMLFSFFFKCVHVSKHKDEIKERSGVSLTISPKSVLTNLKI